MIHGPEGTNSPLLDIITKMQWIKRVYLKIL